MYLVMGGYDGGNERLSSTEQYSPGDDSWRESTALPRPLEAPRAATLGNIVYLTGEMMILIVCLF